MYINLHLPLFKLAYLFFLFFLSFLLNTFVSFIFIALFPNWHLALVLFAVCVLVSFVLVDIIFDFLCSPSQSIVLNFCWTALILFMGVYVYVYIQSHLLLLLWNLCLYIRLFQFCGVFLFFFFLSSSRFFFFFSLFYNFNFLKPITFFLHLLFGNLSNYSFHLGVNL